MRSLRKKLENKKGFTLAELLIVVAIIAVLVAVSIPIFTAQLEKAREAVDAANIRAAYAEISTEALTLDDATSTTAITRAIVLKQQQANWQGKYDFPAEIKEIVNTLAVGQGKTVTLTFTPNSTSATGGTWTATV